MDFKMKRIDGWDVHYDSLLPPRLATSVDHIANLLIGKVERSRMGRAPVGETVEAYGGLMMALADPVSREMYVDYVHYSESLRENNRNIMNAATKIALALKTVD